MNDRRLLWLFVLLGIEGILIILDYGMRSVGYAFLDVAFFSNASFILILAFIFTLLAILYSLKFLHHQSHMPLHYSELSMAFLEGGLELHKSRKEIIEKLEDTGFGRDEIDQFLREWEGESDKT